MGEYFSSSLLFKFEAFMAVVLIVIPCTLIGVFNSQPMWAELSAWVIFNFMAAVWVIVRLRYTDCDGKLLVTMNNEKGYLVMDSSFAGKFNNSSNELTEKDIDKMVNGDCDIVSDQIDARKTGSRWKKIDLDKGLMKTSVSVSVAGLMTDITKAETTDSIEGHGIQILCDKYYLEGWQLLLICGSCLLALGMMSYLVYIASKKQKMKATRERLIAEGEKRCNKSCKPCMMKYPLLAITMFMMLSISNGEPINGVATCCDGIVAKDKISSCYYDYIRGIKICRNLSRTDVMTIEGSEHYSYGIKNGPLVCYSTPGCSGRINRVVDSGLRLVSYILICVFSSGALYAMVRFTSSPVMKVITQIVKNTSSSIDGTKKITVERNSYFSILRICVVVGISSLAILLVYWTIERSTIFYTVGAVGISTSNFGMSLPLMTLMMVAMSEAKIVRPSTKILEDSYISRTETLHDFMKIRQEFKEEMERGGPSLNGTVEMDKMLWVREFDKLLLRQSLNLNSSKVQDKSTDEHWVWRDLVYLSGWDCTVDLDEYILTGDGEFKCEQTKSWSTNVKVVGSVNFDKRCLTPEVVTKSRAGNPSCMLNKKGDKYVYNPNKAMRMNRVKRTKSFSNRVVDTYKFRTGSILGERQRTTGAEGTYFAPTGFVIGDYTGVICSFHYRGGLMYMVEPNPHPGCSCNEAQFCTWKCSIGRRLMYSCNDNTYGIATLGSNIFECVPPLPPTQVCPPGTEAAGAVSQDGWIPLWRQPKPINGVNFKCNGADFPTPTPLYDNKAGDLKWSDGTYSFGSSRIYSSESAGNERYFDYPGGTIKHKKLYLKSFQDTVQQTGAPKYYVYAGLFHITEEIPTYSDIPPGTAGSIGKRILSPFMASEYERIINYSFDFAYAGNRIGGNSFHPPLWNFGSGDCTKLGKMDYKMCGTTSPKPPKSTGGAFPSELFENKIACGDYRSTGSSCDELSTKQGIVKIDFLSLGDLPLARAGPPLGTALFTKGDATQVFDLGNKINVDPKLENLLSNQRQTLEYLYVAYYAVRVNGPYQGIVKMLGQEIDAPTMTTSVCSQINTIKYKGICYFSDMENPNTNVIVGGYPLNENIALYQSEDYNSRLPEGGIQGSNRNLIWCAASHVHGFTTNHPKVGTQYLAQVSDSAYIGAFSKNGKCKTIYPNFNTTSQGDLLCDGERAVKVQLVEYGTFYSEDVQSTETCALHDDTVKCHFVDPVEVSDCVVNNNEVCSKYVTSEVRIQLKDTDLHYIRVAGDFMQARGDLKEVGNHLQDLFMESYTRSPVWSIVLFILCSFGIAMYCIHLLLYVLCYFNTFNLKVILYKVYVLKGGKCTYCHCIYFTEEEANLHKLCKPRIWKDPTDPASENRQSQVCWFCCTRALMKRKYIRKNESGGERIIETVQTIDDWNSDYASHKNATSGNPSQVPEPKFLTFRFPMSTNRDFKGRTDFQAHMFNHQFRRNNRYMGTIRMRRSSLGMVRAFLCSALVLTSVVQGQLLCDGKVCDSAMFHNPTQTLARSGNVGENITVPSDNLDCTSDQCSMKDYVIRLRLVEGNRFVIGGMKDNARYSKKFAIVSVGIETTSVFEYMSTEVELLETRMTWSCVGSQNCQNPEEVIMTNLCGRQGNDYIAYNVETPLKSHWCPIDADCVSPIGRFFWLGAGCIFNSGGIAGYSSYAPKIGSLVSSVFEVTVESISFTVCEVDVMDIPTESCITVSSDNDIEKEMFFIGMNSPLSTRYRIATLSEIGSAEPLGYFMDPPRMTERSGLGPFSFRTEKISTGGVCYQKSTFDGSDCEIDRGGQHPTYRCKNKMPKVDMSTLVGALDTLAEKLNCNPEDSTLEWESSEISRSVTINGVESRDSQTYAYPKLNLELKHCRLRSIDIEVSMLNTVIRKVNFEGTIEFKECTGTANRNGLARLDFVKSSIATNGPIELNCPYGVSETCLMYSSDASIGCNITISYPWKGYCNYGNESIWIDCSNLLFGDHDWSGGDSSSNSEETGNWNTPVSLSWWYSTGGIVSITMIIVVGVVIIGLLIGSCRSMRRSKMKKD
jgi:hypothetical protein